MRITTEAPGPAASPPLWQRLAWMVALWAGGVLSVGAVALLLRWALGA